MPVLDGIGKLALPGLVEAHTQLDKSLLGLPWYRNDVGERLNDKIENERAVRKMLPIDPTRQSHRHAMLAVSHGSTFIRSHVDVDTECGVNIENRPWMAIAGSTQIEGGEAAAYTRSNA